MRGLEARARAIGERRAAAIQSVADELVSEEFGEPAPLVRREDARVRGLSIALRSRLR